MKKKKTFKYVAVMSLCFLLLSGTTIMASTVLLKWTGGETITATNEYIEKSAQKLVDLKAQLDEAVSGGASEETIKELEKQIVLLNEEVQKANTAAASQQSKLDWAMQLLEHNGIVLE